MPPPVDPAALTAHLLAACGRNRTPTRGSDAERRVRAALAAWLRARAEADVTAARAALGEVLAATGALGGAEQLGPRHVFEIPDNLEGQGPASDGYEFERVVWTGPGARVEATSIEFSVGVVANLEVPLEESRLADLAVLGRELFMDAAGWGRALAAVRDLLMDRRRDAEREP